MPKYIEVVKKHPVASGSIVIVVGLGTYLVFRRRVPTSAPPAADTTSQALINAQTGAAVVNAQAAAAREMADLQASVATHQVDAQLQAVALQTQAATDIVNTQTAGTVAVEAGHDATQTQIDSQDNAARTSIASSYFATYLDATHAQLAEQAQEAQYKYNISSSIVTAAARDKSRSSTGYAQIIAALQGQGPQAIAANQPSAVAGSASSVIGSIGKAATGILGGLFGL